MIKHNYAFFGKDQAFIIITKDLKDKVHLNFIKKIDDKWQKLNEGIHLELKLEELCKITEYLEKEYIDNGINIIHQYSEDDDIKNFLFQFSYDKRKKDTVKILFIKAKLDNKPEYFKFSKPFMGEQKRLLLKIFQHLENEKISNFESFEYKRS